MSKPLILIYGYQQETTIGQALFTTLQELAIDFKCLKTVELTMKVEEILQQCKTQPDFNFQPTATDLEYLVSSEQENLQPFILFCYMEKETVVNTLSQLAANKARPIPLKAMLTDNNRQWEVKDLIKELIEEDTYMQLYQKLSQGVELLADLTADSYTLGSWQKLCKQRDTAIELLKDYQNTSISDLETALKDLTVAYFGLQTTI